MITPLHAFFRHARRLRALAWIGCAISMLQGFGLVGPTNANETWRIVLGIGVLLGVWARGVTAPVSIPGFASTLPRLRQRLVLGHSVMAVLAGVVCATFSVSEAPRQVLFAIGAAVFVTAVAATGPTRKYWEIQNTLFVGVIGVMIWPESLNTVSLRYPFGVTCAAGIIALSLLLREYRRPGAAFPQIEASKRLEWMGFSGTMLAIHLPNLFHWKRKRTRKTFKSIMAVPGSSFRVLDWSRAADHEMQVNVVTSRGFGVVFFIAIGYFFNSPESTSILGILILLGANASLDPGRLHPLNRTERARLQFIRHAKNLLANVMPLTLGTIALMVMDPLARLKEPVNISVMEVVIFCGVVLQLSPIAQWLSWRMSPRRIGKRLTTASGDEYKVLILGFVTGIVGMLLTNLYLSLFAQTSVVITAVFMLLVAGMSHYAGAFLLKRDFQTVDLVVGTA